MGWRKFLTEVSERSHPIVLCSTDFVSVQDGHIGRSESTLRHNFHVALITVIAMNGFLFFSILDR